MPTRPMSLTVHRRSTFEGSSSELSDQMQAISVEEGACSEPEPPARKVLLLRHGEGTHNCRLARWNGNPYDTLDPRLTANGISQAEAVAQDPRLAEVELIVVSPLSRAVQTAVTVFGERPKCRTVLCGLHSERWSARCDQGRPKSELAEDFPFIKAWEGFDALPEEWTPTKESDADWKRKRVPAFLAFLKEQPEAKICAVGHGAFYAALLGKHLSNCEIGQIEG